MIHHYKICCLLLLLQSSGKAQTYSHLISDHDIIEIIRLEVHKTVSSTDSDKFTPERIAMNIVDWHQIKELRIDSLSRISSILSVQIDDTLKGIAELFTKTDFVYMAQQTRQTSGKKWQLPRNNIKFVNSCKEGCARFSIPLFNDNHTKAIIYKEEIYNPIAACGLIKVYIKEDDTWKEYKSICIWLM